MTPRNSWKRIINWEEMLLSSNTGSFKFSNFKDSLYRRWPSAEIPYTLSNQYGNYARSVIAKAMKVFYTDHNRLRMIVSVKWSDSSCVKECYFEKCTSWLCAKREARVQRKRVSGGQCKEWHVVSCISLAFPLYFQHTDFHLIWPKQ